MLVIITLQENRGKEAKEARGEGSAPRELSLNRQFGQATRQCFFLGAGHSRAYTSYCLLGWSQVCHAFFLSWLFERLVTADVKAISLIITHTMLVNIFCFIDWAKLMSF